LSAARGFEFFCTCFKGKANNNTIRGPLNTLSQMIMDEMVGGSAYLKLMVCDGGILINPSRLNLLATQPTSHSVPNTHNGLHTICRQATYHPITSCWTSP
jgi:hypothetical protein